MELKTLYFERPGKTNTDATLHNVRSAARENRSFNRGIAGQGKGFTRVFSKPEVMLQIKCDVHPWMVAYGGILSHPFHAVSDEEGAFELSRLPAGTYLIEAWHEELGDLEQEVSLEDEQIVELKFSFNIP